MLPDNGGITVKCPCKGCDRRLIGCHGLCHEYREWRTEREKHRERPEDKPEFPRKMKIHIWRKMLHR